MTTIRAAFYARVSSEQQATAHTIESQIAALSERAQSDGTPVPSERQFVDDGYSGATLIRPALDRLRDLATVGAVDRIYVHSPDRLARNYAYQVLLLDEWRRRGVELVFLNRPLGQSPEDDLLLQVQGIVAEYERAKIMERSRRGKKHAAQSGSLNVMSNAPFGYSYVSVREGGGHARFEPVAEQARIVQQIFFWIGRDRCSLAEVCRRLQRAGELTATGKRIWSRQAVWHILRNPAYQGRAAYGKTHMMPRGKKVRLRAARGRPTEPRRSNAPVAADPKDWVFVQVPALVDVALFRATRTATGEPESGSPGAAKAWIPSAGSHLLRKMWLRLLRQDHPSNGRWPSNEGLSLLPMQWNRWLSVWRRANLQQCADAGRVSGNGRVARGVRSSEESGEVGTRL
jgi:site-specific DNA recombinase